MTQSILSRAMFHASTGLVRTAGRSCKYTAKANGQSIEVEMAIDEVSYEADSNLGPITTWQGYSFACDREALDFGSGHHKPARGDTIQYTDEFGVTRTCQVNFLDGEQPFRISPNGRMMTVHAKQI